MKLSLHIGTCFNRNLSVQEALLLLCLKFNALTNEYVQKLIAKGLLTFRANGFVNDINLMVLTDKGANTIETLLAESSIPETEISKTRNRLFNIAKQMQDIYPDGIRPGTRSPWRDNIRSLVDRLYLVFSNTGIPYTDEQIIEATKNYVQSFNGCYTYMLLLKNFICTSVTIGNENVLESKLLSCLENKDIAFTNNLWNYDLI